MEEVTAEQGRIVAVCLRATTGVPKYPQGSVAVESQGVAGDFHAGPVNRHKKRGDPEPNWRQVTLLAQEVLEELSSRLGIQLKPGDLGENILVAGLGDLSRLSPGERLHLGREVVLEVTAQNRPCDTIRVYHPDLVEEITGRRGGRRHGRGYRDAPAGRCLPGYGGRSSAFVSDDSTGMGGAPYTGAETRMSTVPMRS